MNESSSPLGFVAPEPSELALLFPGYEIIDLIATGGMGAVYRAVQKSLDRTVALKILPMEFSQDPEFCAGFEAEAKAMARLNHPNLIGVFDFGEVNGMLFIVMEFVHGKSLHHSAYGQAIQSGEVIRLITGVCNGLTHAHENGILHRDIKPSNILLTPQAEPKIGDFGLASPIEAKTAAGGVVFGTPGYTAPEVVDAPDMVDHRADVFSTGVLLHELLTGKLPADDPRPASVISRCDVRFDSIIRKATDPVAAQRYSSAAEIAADLQKIKAASATGPMVNTSGSPRGGAIRPPAARRATTTKSKRKPMNLTWVGPLIALAVMGYAVYTFINGKPKIILVTEPARETPANKNSMQGPATLDVPEKDASLPTLPSSQRLSNIPGKPKCEVGGNSDAGVNAPGDLANRIYDATDLKSLRGMLGKVVRVEGRVLKDGVNKKGTMRFLNFTEPYENSLSVMMLVSDAREQFTKPKLEAYAGKLIQFSGPVLNHEGALQIQVKGLAELKIVEDGQVIGMKSMDSNSPIGTRKTPPGIPSDAEYFNGKWYVVYLERGDWKSARAKCVERGGRLAVIPNVETQDFLKNLTIASPAWIGATDELREGQWIWSDGTEMSFKAFGLNEPDNRREVEDYLFMLQGRWCDTSAKDSGVPSFVCEWKDSSGNQTTSIDPENTGSPTLTETKIPKEIPKNAKHFNGKLYSVYEEMCTWTTARDKCKNMGGQLVVVPDISTQNFVSGLAPGKNLWLGGSDEEKEGTWVWVDGSKFGFTQFCPGEPGGGLKENYLVLSGLDQGSWGDYADSGPPSGKWKVVGYICEWRDADNITTSQPQDIVVGHGNQIPNGQTLDIVGTWKFSDTNQLEIKPDGTVLSNTVPCGKWTQRDKKTEYLITFNNRSAYIATLDKYKRTLTTAGRVRGEMKSMERIDNGPTRNSEVPDQTTAWKMECSDIETAIKSMESRFESAKRDAADKWKKYNDTKANGRSVNRWDNEARKAESQARGLDMHINVSRMRLMELHSKLDLK